LWNKTCLNMDSLTNDEVHFMEDSLTKLKSYSGVHFNQTIFEMHRKLQFFFDFSACPLNVRQELSHLLGNCLDERADQFNDREEILDLLVLVRVLSRDKEFSDFISETKLMAYLFHFSNLQEEDFESLDNGPWDLEVRLEAKKVLCNLLFNSEKARNRLSSITGRLQINELPMRERILRLENSVRAYVFIDSKFGATARRIQCTSTTNSNVEPLSTTVVDLATETFKANETSIFFDNLVLLCRRYLVSACECAPKHQNLISQVVNVLTLCIPETYPLLIPVCSFDSTGNDKIYRGYDVSALNVILQLLSKQCDDSDTGVMQPTLALLICIARSNRIYRKYLRHEILPPLKDVHTRPENDVTIRGKLVRFMTSVTHVSMWVADFLFVLCKENAGFGCVSLVDRLVKYTGFGNAAGLLASLGMLTSAQLKNSKTDDSNCSSSTDSETEEYKQAKDLINPVLGCVETPKPNPMEGMTEEEKEHEAVQLVNQIDSLMKQGLVMPARVCEDGKVHPIEHVLQLQEGLPETATASSDSD
ncbi:Synembryn-A, partial [Trichinella sp. T6]